MPASTPGQGSLFKIRYGSQAAYDGLATKDANTVYFLTDTGKIAVGDTYYNDSSFRYIGHRNTISAITSNDRKEGNVVSVGDAEQLYTPQLKITPFAAMIFLYIPVAELRA